MKTCKKCCVKKEDTEFYPHKGMRDGRLNTCKKCHNRASADRNSKSEARKEYMKAYLKKYRSKPENREKERKHNERYRKSEKGIVARAKYAATEKSKEIKRRYATSEVCKVKSRERGRKRRKNDPAYKLTINLRRRFLHFLKGTAKRGSVMKLIGCSVEDLKKHIEKQFKEGMTWDNWTVNGWHIDHIKPLHSFDLTDDEQMKEAWHYSNLRPLWAKENHSRPKKIIESRNI